MLCCCMFSLFPIGPKGFDEREGRIKDRNNRQREAKLAGVGGGGPGLLKRKGSRRSSSGSGGKNSVAGKEKIKAKRRQI